MRWAEMTSRQIDATSRSCICVLPIGALEQHGPHLPVATDTIIAEAIGDALDAECRRELLMLPPLCVTCSWHHMAFPGTLTIDHEIFAATVSQVLSSAAAHGYRRFFLLNAHGGNMAIGGVAVEQLAALLPECDVVFATWFRAASNELRSLVEGEYPAVGHACEFETSLVMAIRPDLVVHEAIADDGNAATQPLLRSDMLIGGPVVRSVSFHEITTNGVWGKPSLATPDKGRAILDVVIPVLKKLLGAHWPDAPGMASEERANGQPRECAPKTGADLLEGAPR
jgi:creatinine amidohydrolase